MTTIQKRALAVLKKHGPMTASNFGAEIWGHTKHRKPQSWARPASTVLAALKKKVLVTVEFDGHHWLWRCTLGGLRALGDGDNVDHYVKQFEQLVRRARIDGVAVVVDADAVAIRLMDVDDLRKDDIRKLGETVKVHEGCGGGGSRCGGDPMTHGLP